MWTSAPNVKFANYIEAVDLPGLSTKPGRIHSGLNSGYSALGWVYHQGAIRIVLLAYDMQRGPKGESHFHGDHEGGLPNLGTMPEWARLMIQLGIELRYYGVEVLNASRRTAITCFERMTLEKALREAGARKTAALMLPQPILPVEHEAFRTGLSAVGYRVDDAKPDVTVVWIGERKYSGGKTLYAENGYWSPPDEPYVALAVDGHNGAGTWPKGCKERLERLQIPVKPWRTEGKHILVCESGKNGHYPPPKDWTKRTVEILKRHTDRPIRVRPHPGMWKLLPEHPDVSLAKDLENAWACVIWHTVAGVRALAWGIPVIYTAPHWICEGAAGNCLTQIENPPMPDRLPAFERLASAQWSLSEIASGEPFRVLLPEVTVLCVLKTGGDYNAEYVRKLRDGVKRHLTVSHRFVCLSDVEVPCERIPLKHGWRGWWSKLEVFRPDVITGPTLYLDLDTVITGNLDPVTTIPYDFAMLDILERNAKVGNSGAMWIAKPFPYVYERFAEKPEHWIKHHEKNAKNRYMGDQAFISDCFEEIPKLHHALPGFFKGYKYDHCQDKVPESCSVVCFGGPPRPHQAGGWVKRVWV